jgi:hypothetical protein
MDEASAEAPRRSREIRTAKAVGVGAHPRIENILPNSASIPAVESPGDGYVGRMPSPSADGSVSSPGGNERWGIWKSGDCLTPLLPSVPIRTGRVPAGLG